MDYYEELGIDPLASEEEIRRAHRRLTKLMHPDQQMEESMKALAETQMRRLNAIVEILTDPERRREYDSLLKGEVPEASPPAHNPTGRKHRGESGSRGTLYLGGWAARSAQSCLLSARFGFGPITWGVPSGIELRPMFARRPRTPAQGMINRRRSLRGKPLPENPRVLSLASAMQSFLLYHAPRKFRSVASPKFPEGYRSVTGPLRCSQRRTRRAGTRPHRL